MWLQRFSRCGNLVRRGAALTSAPSSTLINAVSSHQQHRQLSTVLATRTLGSNVLDSVTVTALSQPQTQTQQQQLRRLSTSALLNAVLHSQPQQLQHQQVRGLKTYIPKVPADGRIDNLKRPKWRFGLEDEDVEALDDNAKALLSLDNASREERRQADIHKAMKLCERFPGAWWL